MPSTGRRRPSRLFSPEAVAEPLLTHVHALVRPIRQRAQRRCLRFRRLVPFRSPAVRGRRHREPCLGRRARRRRRAVGRGRGLDPHRAHRHPRQGAGRPGLGLGRRRRRALVCGAPARRAHRRRRPPPAYRALAQRAGVARPAPVPQAPKSRPAEDNPPVDRRLRDARRAVRRVAHAGLHAPAARAARPHRALPARPRCRAAARSRALRHRRLGSRRAAARVGRGRGHQLRHRHHRSRLASRLQPRRHQQHRRIGRSRLRRPPSCTPAR